jgi:transposase
MDDQAKDVGSTPVLGAPVEGWMLREDVVREVLARLARGEHVKAIARELGVDKKTIKRWRHRGGWQPRAPRVYPKAIDAHRPFLERRGPEVGWNGAVLLRELRTQGFTGGYQQVQRSLQPLRTTRQWAARATVRFETGPGEQAQIDFGQLQVWIADVETPVHFFVFTLGFSRRAVAYAYRNERLDTLLDGHERALRHFGGVPLSCLYDNPRTITTGRSAGHVLWHPRFEDFARYYGFTPRACQPYRARTKGKVESGVKYVKRNALAGRRFASWAALEAWLEEWAATVSDLRVHGTTHERPIDRFARETLTPLGHQPPYHYTAPRRRIVAADALVAIAAGRYSVPVRYVGQTVDVRETATHYVIVAGATCIAQHAKAGRHAVVMEPAHYAGLLRPGVAPRTDAPQWDPAYHALGAVEVRDLAIYETLSGIGGDR